MAPRKINYGSKKQIYANKNIGSKPIFLLAEETKDDIINNNNNINVKKCFCSECQSTFDTDISIKRERYTSTTLYENNIPINMSDESIQNISDMECPDCHNKSSFACIARNENKTPKEGHINMSNAWVLPPIPSGRYIFTYEDENNIPTRIDDNIMLNNTIIFPSGKKFNYQIEYSESTDLMRNSIKVTKSKIYGDKRENLDVKDSINRYKYDSINTSYSATDVYGIRHANKVADPIVYDYKPIYLQNNNILQNSLFNDNSIGAVKFEIDKDGSKNPKRANRKNGLTKEFAETATDVSNLKIKTVEKRFTTVDDVYKQSKINGLFLAEHHPGSNEENTPLSDHKMSEYFNMMVRYPAAYEYACERVDNRVANHFFAEKRKADADSSYTPREIATSAKAKMLREEVKFVSEQLAAVDDKILDTISSSKDVNDMKQKLQFYVFGDNENINDTQIPKNIRMKDGQTMQDPIQATKSLKASFKNNPIGTANTVYTCHKIGIKDTNHINQMITIANNAPEINPAPIRKGGQRINVRVEQVENVNAQTICPVRTRDAQRFLRNYANTHNHSDVIKDIYGDADKFKQYMECVRIYSTIIPYAKIADKPDEIKSNMHEIEKNQVRGYLMNKSVQEAYVDFIEKYKENTPKVINEFVKEIEHDKQQDTIKAFYDQHGLDETLTKYGDHLKDIEDPKTYLDEYVPFQDKQYVLATRNNKPLFQNRTMAELHDELSHMAKNVVRENTPISYSDEEKAFEAEYDAPDGSGKWSFNLHKDTFEMIRTATEMSNCLASHTNRALNKYETLLFMKNEMGEKVGCISLNKRGDKWYVDEFQSPHDNAMDARYKDICLQWLDEHEINYAGNHNVAAFGTNASFYGGHDVDYHDEEIDETTNTAVSVSQMKIRKENRLNLAREIYGVDNEGNIKLPETPTF